MTHHSIFDNSSLTKSDVLAANAETKSLVAELLHSMAYGCIQSPLNGATQLIDRMFNTRLLKSAQLIEELPQASLASDPARWHAQQIGSALGMAAPFLLLHHGVERASNFALGKEMSLATKSMTSRVIAQTALTGALYEGIFRPVGFFEEDNFLAARARNAVVGAATFATLAGANEGIKRLGKGNKISVAPKLMHSPIGTSVLAGIPAGLVSAHGHSLLSGRGLCTGQETAESMYAFSFTGGALSLGKAAKFRTGEISDRLATSTLHSDSPIERNRLMDVEREVGLQYQRLRTIEQDVAGSRRWIPDRRFLYELTDHVQSGLDMVRREQNPFRRQALSECWKTIFSVEMDLERWPDGYKGTNNSPDLLRFLDPASWHGKRTVSDRPYLFDPESRLTELSEHLRARKAEDDSGRAKLVRNTPEIAKRAVLAEPVVEAVIEEATKKTLHPFGTPDARVVFVDNAGKPITFLTPGGWSSGFSLPECTDPAVLQTRLMGQRITGAYVFRPWRSTSNDYRYISFPQLSSSHGLR